MCETWSDLSRSLSGIGIGISGEEAGESLRQRGSGSSRHAGRPRRERSRPVLQEGSEAGDFSLSLALPRREQLGKVALAISQKSSAHPEIEASRLSCPGTPPGAFRAPHG